MLLREALVRTDVSEEPSASFIKVTRIGELMKTLAVTSNRRNLRRNTTCIVTYSELHDVDQLRYIQVRLFQSESQQEHD
jgi:hypothetical protein